MTTDWLTIIRNPQAPEAQKLLAFCQGNAEAARYLMIILQLCHFYDDWYDQDKPISHESFRRHIWMHWAELPINPFRTQYFADLYPLEVAALQDWLDANELEQMDDEHARTIAWGLRDSVSQIVAYVARLCGGFDWALEIGPQMRLWLYDEPLKEYINDT